MGKEDEPHIDDLLNGIVRAEKLRRAFLRSAMWRTLYDFEAGDRVQLDLLGVKIDGVLLESDQALTGTLVDPKLLHIDVIEASGLPEIVGERIGLATDTRVNTPAGIAVNVTLQKCIAGNQEIAYYLARDMERTDGGHLAPEDKIRHAPLRYGRLVVRDRVLFDFITDLS